MKRLFTRASLLSLATLCALTVAACNAPTDATAEGSEDDLTSLTARQRALTFEGLVYVPVGATDEAIVEVARKQTQTAFGALLNQKIAVQSRELQTIDVGSFRKRAITVFDTGAPGAAGEPMTEVRYVYRDNAVVPVESARRTTLPSAVLGTAHTGAINKIVEACTKNDKEARDDAAGGLLWYDFDPGRSTCRRMMEAEQRAIDADTAKLEDPKTQVSKSRVNRLMLPTTMRLARAENATTATYPEYDKLFSGGVRADTLTLALVVGRLGHKRVEAYKDGGYYEWMAALEEIFRALPGFELKQIEPNEALDQVTVGNRKITELSFAKFVEWTIYDTGWPSGVTGAERTELKQKVGAKLDNHWLTFERKVKVTIGNGPEKDFTLRIDTLFGVEEDQAPHKRALRGADVVVYNGHSYIGYGPLDPGNFTRESFPSTYQLFFFDSCVSYNYYEKDFFALKTGGSKNLDLMTNGLEAPEYLSGEAEGKLIAKLLSGDMPSYQTLLALAKDTDSLRVVDGEIDNAYRPTRVPIRVSTP